MGRRLLSIITAGLLGAGAVSCDAIFGIGPGELTGGGGSASTSSSSTATGGEGGATSSTATSCGKELAAPVGEGYQFRNTNVAGAEATLASAFDSQGNLVVAGWFNGDSINLGGGDLPHTPKQDPYDANLFVAKYSPTNNHAWSRAFGGELSAIAYSVAVGPDDEVWVLGSFRGTIQVGQELLESAVLGGDPAYEDMFVIKLDAGGEVVFAKRFGSEYREYGMAVAVDAAGNAYAAGAGWNTIDFGTGQFGVVSDWSSFLLKLAPDGEPVWVDWHASWSPDFNFYPVPTREIGVAVGPDGNVLFAGNFAGQSYFGDQIDAPSGGVDAFVVKLDPDGDLLWKQFLHGPEGDDGDQAVTALTADPCTGDVYVAGVFRTALEAPGKGSVLVSVGDPIEDDMFLVKLAGASGQPVWSRTFGDAGFQRIFDVAVDPAGDVIAIGTLRDGDGYQGVDFGPGVGVKKPAVASPGPDYLTDLFLLKMSSEGDNRWGHRVGDGGDQVGWSVDADAAGNIGVAGEFDSTMKLPGYNVYNSNYYDGFAGWLSP